MKRKLLCSLMVVLMMVIVMPAMAGFSFASENTQSDSIVMVKATAVGTNEIKLKWNSIPDATEYIVYGARCSNDYKKIATSTKINYIVKNIKGKKLKPHKLYKFHVVAKTSKGEINSENIHLITGKTTGKYANTKSIQATPRLRTLQIGEKANIKTKIKVFGNKKHIPASHGKAIRYISSNPRVASVNKNGKIQALFPGQATIYVQDICGAYDTVGITVEGVSYYPIEYRITLNLEGGNGEQLVYAGYGQRICLTNIPTRTGHSFDGMFTEPVAGDQVISADGNPIPNVPGYTDASARWNRTQDTTLYAHWDANQYVITFDANGGTGGIATADAIYDQPISEVTSNPTRTGYRFDGWYTASSDGELVINASGNALPDVSGNTDSSANWVRTADTTLYAHWIANEYTIEFNANNGTGNMEDLSMTYDVPKSLSDNAFTRSGYIFAGWSKTSNGSTEFDNKSSVNNLTTANNGTVTLYALWATKGDLIKIKGTDGTFVDQDGGNATANGSADVFRIIRMVSSDAIELLAMSGPVTNFDQVDGYLNNTYASKLENKLGQNAIEPQVLTRYNYYYYSYNPGGTTYKGANCWAQLNGSSNMGSRKVYALDVKDVFGYFGGNTMNLAQGSIMYFNSTAVNLNFCWLRSTCNRINGAAWICGWNVGATYNLAAGVYNLSPGQARASFVLNTNAVDIRK